MPGPLTVPSPLPWWNLVPQPSLSGTQEAFHSGGYLAYLLRHTNLTHAWKLWTGVACVQSEKKATCVKQLKAVGSSRIDTTCLECGSGIREAGGRAVLAITLDASARGITMLESKVEEGSGQEKLERPNIINWISGLSHRVPGGVTTDNRRGWEQPRAQRKGEVSGNYPDAKEAAVHKRPTDGSDIDWRVCDRELEMGKRPGVSALDGQVMKYELDYDEEEEE
ncbi:hypothetical protein NDU88_004240 [Pleurodeles waltl]|uniref:Uncharacterized protein n=1 Tax=Pleurodeles waltl TaxID=8319 RepID=A0AAV7PF16_PLEWA|nr:hypothetical protein NDU88_004240 [Pleurodeles waltl]